LQESVRLNNRVDKQDEKLDALDWRTSINSEDSTWPKIPVVSEQKAEIVLSSNMPTSSVSKISKTKFIRKAQQAKKRNMKKSSVVDEVREIQETASEIISVSDREFRPSITEIVNSGAAENISFEELHKNKKEGTVLLIGDSLARGVGCNLKSQHNMFVSQAFGGARIEDITKKVEEIEDNERHIVVMVGTNNLKSDGTTLIMNKYKDLITQLQAKKFKRTSVVEILARNDLSNYINSRRIAMNIQLKELCEKNDINFLEIAIDKDVMLDCKGLHLNFSGQDKVARSIFKHSVNFLN